MKGQGYFTLKVISSVNSWGSIADNQCRRQLLATSFVDLLAFTVMFL
jgi:hypothetical protein